MKRGSPGMTSILRRRLLILPALIGCGGGLLAGQGPAITFDTYAAGAPPADFALLAMRQPQPGVWRVDRDGSQAFLTHAADAAATGYALALGPAPPLRDLSVAARVKLAGGARTGGLVWRCQDASNYFAVLLDLTRGVLSMYRVVDGNRVTIEREGDLELDPDAWHTLKVVHDGTHVYVSLGGIRVINERDGRLDRFGPGRAGVIATGDSDVRFDDLRIEPPPERR